MYRFWDLERFFCIGMYCVYVVSLHTESTDSVIIGYWPVIYTANQLLAYCQYCLYWNHGLFWTMIVIITSHTFLKFGTRERSFPARGSNCLHRFCDRWQAEDERTKVVMQSTYTSGSNSLNSRKLPGCFSLPKQPGNDAKVDRLGHPRIWRDSGHGTLNNVLDGTSQDSPGYPRDIWDTMGLYM